MQCTQHNGDGSSYAMLREGHDLASYSAKFVLIKCSANWSNLSSVSTSPHNPLNVVYHLQSLWKSRLQNKFQNARKREDRDIPVVKARKRKATMTTGDLVPKKKTALQWGMANYLPSRRASEDDASIELHVEWMQQESRKKKPNYQRVGESLMATFADRRRWVVTQGALASEVGEKYPWIFKEDEVCFPSFVVVK